MKFGYLLFAAENPDIDYNKLAYSLAISIKNTQKEGYDNVSLVTDNVDAVGKFKSPWVFDKVIKWDKEPGWDGRSWMDKLTPYENTVCLDADMLFNRDISHCIDHFVQNSELYIPSKVYTYRGEEVVGDFYRRAFVKNNLPNLYSFFTFFKKDSAMAAEFFTLGRYIIKNPTEFSNNFLNKFKPKLLGTDEAFALSAEILGLSDQISYPLNFPKIVHMKPMVQNWPWPADVWSNHVGFYFNKHNELKIGNYKQYDIVHYVEKKTITDEIIHLQEEKLWNK